MSDYSMEFYALNRNSMILGSDFRTTASPSYTSRRRKPLCERGSRKDQEVFYDDLPRDCYRDCSRDCYRDCSLVWCTETGRTIPEREIVRSLQSPEESIRLLAPKTDLVVRITNESTIKLCSVEDYSGNWHQG